MTTIGKSHHQALHDDPSRIFTLPTFINSTNNRSVPKRIYQSLRSRCDGGALVEFALVAPLMLGLITGMFSFGIALTTYTQLTNAVDIGARTLAVSRASNTDGTTPDPCATAVSAITNSAPSLKATSISYSFVLNGVSYPNVNTCSTGVANVISGKNAQVTATYPYTVMLFGWKPVVMTLKSQTSELMQ
jgi:Flp pilus assembly protein TadG